MRIAYIVLLKHASAGVAQTLIQKARALDALGYQDFDILAIGPDPIFADSPRLRHVPVRRGPLPWWLFRTLFRRYRIIEASVDLTAYDRILLRYPSADPSGPGFMDRWPVWTEHHTLELEELAAGRDGAASPVVRQLKRLRLRLEHGYGGAVLARSRGLVGVTDEIAAYELARVKRPLAAVTIANGGDIEATPLTGFRPFDGRCLELVAVASRNAPWHGLDRVIEGMRHYLGDARLRLHLVGDFSVAELGHSAGPRGEILYYGTLQGEALDRVVGGVNLALSTLAISRKGMREGCPLKSREYMARGIPFVYAYTDPDLRAMEDGGLPFALRVPDAETGLPIAPLLEYAARLVAAGPPERLCAAMREYARQHMDWEDKMRRCADFLRAPTCPVPTRVAHHLFLGLHSRR